MSDEQSYQRRLSTIIAVDVVGYSHLVQENEDAAIRAVDRVRTAMARVLEDRGGRIFNHAGDGVMAETPSAVEGVRAAFQIHRAVREANALNAEDPNLEVRIGVNLGDVVAKDDGDLVGHGVNIAARLESIAAPGETVISHAVYEQIRGAVEELFQAAGYEKLKNIDAPIAVYRAHPDGSLAPRGVKRLVRSPKRMMPWLLAGTAVLALGAVGTVALLRPAPVPVPLTGQQDGAHFVAVLPFANIGGETKNEFFSDGVTEEIRSALMRLEDITVLGRTSSAVLGASDGTPSADGPTGATHFLEGSVRRDGTRVRVAAQLIEASSGIHLWSETYSREIVDVFALQEEIAAAIAGALETTFRPAEKSQQRPVDAQTFEIYLRARDLLNQRGAALPQAIRLFETAVSRDPDFADAWAGLASASHVLPGYSNTPYSEVQMMAQQAAGQALRVNPQSAEALAVLAAQDREAGRWKAADDRFQEALAFEPSNVSVVYYYAEFLLGVGRAQDGLAMFEKAYEIDPLSPYTSTGVGWGAYLAGDPKGARAAFERAWSEFGLRLPVVWEGIFSLLLDEKDFDGARAFVDQWPGPAMAKPLYHQFVDALANAEVPPQDIMAMFAQAEQSMALPWYLRYEASLKMGRPDEAAVIALDAAQTGQIVRTHPLFIPSSRPVWAYDEFEQIADHLGLVRYWQTVGAPDLCASDRGALPVCRRLPD